MAAELCAPGSSALAGADERQLIDEIDQANGASVITVLVGPVHEAGTKADDMVGFEFVWDVRGPV